MKIQDARYDQREENTTKLSSTDLGKGSPEGTHSILNPKL